MKKVLITFLLICSISNSLIFSETITDDTKSLEYTIYLGASVVSYPYSISFKYNNSDLSETTSTSLSVDDRSYKLTEASVTQPFYINISSGKIVEDTKFIISIETGEFIGEDYKEDPIYTEIYPTINQYGEFNYSFDENDAENIATMTYYQEKGLIVPKHIGAFTFEWPDNNYLSSGKYTSTNIITITSEKGSEPSI